MCKNPGLGPSDYKPKPRTIYDLKLHETMDIHVGYKFYHHETGVDEAKKYIKVMRVEGGWIYGVDTQTPSFVPQVSVKEKKDTPEPEKKSGRSVGNHKRVFEYDGSYHCLDCDAKWGAITNGLDKPPMLCEHWENKPDKTVKAPDLEWVSEGIQPPPPPATTEYVNKKSNTSTLGIIGGAVRRFFGGE